MVLAVVCGPAGQALGWGATGHEWISGIAIEKLPDDVPAFVHTADARAAIAMMGWEPDRSKGAGESHDNERDPGHYVNLSDDAKVMGIVPLHTLPVAREGYEHRTESWRIDAVQGRIPALQHCRRVAGDQEGFRLLAGRSEGRRDRKIAGGAVVV
jgi:hypothetical protein